MAKCPNNQCDKIHLWDWCNDLLVYPDGTELRKMDLMDNRSPEDFFDIAHEVDPEKPAAQVIAYVCDCGMIVHFVVYDHWGSTAFPREWYNVDWETDEHSFQRTQYEYDPNF